jgi:hypothetical protein
VENSGDFSIADLYGDATYMGENPPFGTNDITGGNDAIIANNSGYFSKANLYGDAFAMEGNAQGGDDKLTANNSGDGADAQQFGDAEMMFDNTKGGMIFSMAVMGFLAMPSSIIPAVPVRSPEAPIP